MARKKSLYGVHPSVAMVAKWVDEMPDKTGHSLEDWLKIIKRDGPAAEKDRRTWLKAEHGFGTNTAWWLAETSFGRGSWDHDPEAYLKQAEEHVEKMFAGKKEALKPIYDALLDLGLKQGKDVKACPCQTIVPLYRKHVFAQLKPTTLTRIDLGLALKDTKAKGRLIDTGGFAKKDRISHRIPISSIKEIDAEVKNWLKMAYDMDA